MKNLLGGKDFLDGEEHEQIRSKRAKQDRRSIKRQHRENTRNYVEKSKQEKNHGVASKSIIINRLQGDKEEDLTTALYNSFRFSPSTT